MSQAARNKQESVSSPVRVKRSLGDITGVLFFLTVCAVLLWCGWAVISWMDDSHRVTLSKLVVTGERRFTRDDDIRQAILSLGLPGTFMSQDVDVIQKQVMRLPWIKQVSVRKQWPDELKLHIVEYNVFARWNNVLLLDKEGTVFSVPSDRIDSSDLLDLEGPENQEQEVLQQYQALSQQLQQIKQVGEPFVITSLVMNERFSWYLVLNNDIKLVLGRDQIKQRLARFLEIYPIILKKSEPDKLIATVDLRYETGAAVTWKSAG